MHVGRTLEHRATTIEQGLYGPVACCHPQIDLMNQGRRLEGVAFPLIVHALPRQVPQLLVNQRKKLAGRLTDLRTFSFRGLTR